MKHLYILVFILSPVFVFSQYTETFNVANKGILSGSCSNNDPSSCTSTDFNGVNWTIGGNLSGIDSEGFFTRTGYLLSEDLDEEACWISPTLDISTSGNVSLTVTISIPSGTAWETSTTLGSIDYADVKYSIDGGSFTTLANVTSCPGSGHTISVSSCGSSLSGPQTFTPNISGLSGSTLDIQVCFDTNSQDDDGHLEEISVPQANVVILPVELISFDARQEDKFLKLFWITATELNNDGFEIEASANGIEFHKVGQVRGKGNSVERQDYSFEVRNPLNGISYYRLKQIDFDGQFEYSKVISVNFKGENGDVGEFYPNPSKSGLVNLDYTSQTDEEISIVVFDVTGTIVVNQIQQVSIGDNNLSFDFSELNTGIYIVKIGDERNPTHRKLIIER